MLKTAVAAGVAAAGRPATAAQAIDAANTVDLIHFPPFMTHPSKEFKETE
ncbi:hypothetical protein GCM10027019_00210 [Melaminivora jejuensis]